eukprot:654973-Lingulodinium_polyedra.AAC.1
MVQTTRQRHGLPGAVPQALDILCVHLFGRRAVNRDPRVQLVSGCALVIILAPALAIPRRLPRV